VDNISDYICICVQKNKYKYKQNGGQLTVTDRYGIFISERLNIDIDFRSEIQT